MREEFEDPVWLHGTGHVNFVYADWPYNLYNDYGEDDEEEDEEEEDEEEAFEPIDGCTKEDVGWMKVATTGLRAQFFHYSGDIQGWQDQYVRPPDLLYL
jgi:hypothetical protein